MTRFKGIETLDLLDQNYLNDRDIKRDWPDLRGLKLESMMVILPLSFIIKRDWPDLRGLKPSRKEFLKRRPFLIKRDWPDLRGLKPNIRHIWVKLYDH